MDVIGSAPELADHGGPDEDRPAGMLRRWRTAGAVVVVAALGAWAIGTEPFGDRTQGRTTPRPAASDFAMAIGVVLGEPRAVGPAFQVVLDGSRWYALVARCTGPGRCTEQLSVSADGGASWRRHRLPSGTSPGQGMLQVLAPSALLLSTPGGRWVSSDGGLHWRAGGTNVPLTPQPPLRNAAPTAVRPSDGSLWVSGTDAGGRPAVAVSQDGGRSWVTNRLPLPTTQVVRTTLLTLDGRTAYALVAQPAQATRLFSLDGIARTDNGGRTWRVVRPVGGSRPDTAVAAALLPDGRLLVSLESPQVGLFFSDDGGQSFHLQRDAPSGLAWFGNAGDQLLAEGGGYVWRMSPAGRWYLLKP